jgi:hypothetical protein
MPVFLEAPSHHAAGPDGKGWNRLRVDVYLHDQCAMQPRSYPSLKYESSNTMLAKWGCFGHCTREGKCDDCPLMEPTSLDLEVDKVLVRIDDKNVPHLMNRPDKGWGESSYDTSWTFLARLEGWTIGERYRDEHSEGFWIHRVD